MDAPRSGIRSWQYLGVSNLIAQNRCCDRPKKGRVQNAVRYSGHRNSTVANAAEGRWKFKMQSDIQDIETVVFEVIRFLVLFKMQSDIQDIETSSRLDKYVV